MKSIPSQIVRCLLIGFGVGFNEQPETVKGRRALLDAFIAESPELYDRLYSVIVNGVDPIEVGLDNDLNVITQSEVASQVRDIFSEVSNEAAMRVDGIARDNLILIQAHINAISKKTAEAIEAEAKKFTTIKVNTSSKTATYSKASGNVMPAVLPHILELAAQRKNILLVGPAGCGKTFIAKEIANAMGMDFASQSCTAGMSESMLSGWLLPIGDAGKFEYVPSEFVRIYENGGVFLLDEIDAADSNVLIFINQAIANGEFYLPQRVGNPKVTKHNDAVIIAAANTFGNGADMVYVGRNQLDAATLDRFKIGTVTMDYDPDVEVALVCTEVLEWGLGVRGKISSSHLQRIMSTRVMIDATDMFLNQNWTIEKISNAYFSDWSKEEMVVVNGY